ncbi:DinB family protein [Chryseobacterium paridis]|uniref:DinB family protein n=1 Tax=Chryseobacterium paridis TaxID=2800328 RepID=A0ABS1FSJ3_9FLAO|nr:DinB family protein [Chryseobacterium paridis]MBK1895363.1 DinB family protein [Chryseobacterium paridis]
MDTFRFIQHIQSHLKTSFNEVDKWFDADNKALEYIPIKKGWSVRQILEHIYLTNFYLLILIEKGMKKAIRNDKGLDLKLELENYNFDKTTMEQVGVHGAFIWIRPEHMEPKDEMELTEIRKLISQQLQQCLGYLELMKNGEGLLYKTTMTVNDLGKINVYEYIYFLSLHAQRHITQMKNNDLEAIKKANSDS